MTQQEPASRRWLEIVEEGLQLKREIQTVQKLLRARHENNCRDITNSTSVTMMNKMKQQLSLPGSVLRASSVKSLSGAERPNKKLSKRRSLQVEPVTDGRRRRSKMAKLYHGDEEEDKENAFQPLRRSTPFTPTSQPSKELIWNGKKYVMTDDSLDQSSHNIRCLPKNFLTPTGLRRKSSSKSSSSSKSKLRRLTKDLSTPKIFSPKVTDSKPRVDYGHEQARVLGEYVEQDLSVASDDVSLGFAGRIGGRVVELSPKKSKAFTPILPANLNVNNKTIRDISDISTICNKSTYHEQASSANLSGAFHSTFQYPLHSTFQYPLHSSFNFSMMPKIQEEHRTPTNADSCSCMSDNTLSFDDHTSIDVDKEDTLCNSSILSCGADDLSLTDCSIRYHTPTTSIRQKTMKRQSGQATLKHRRNPVGLSESDFLSGHDITQSQNMSLSATRATLPSFSDLSDDESALLESGRKRKRTQSRRESIQIPFCTLIGFEQTASTAVASPRTPLKAMRPSRKFPSAPATPKRVLSERPPCIGAESPAPVTDAPSFSNISGRFVTTRAVTSDKHTSSKHISKDRKRALAKKIRDFSFQQHSSTGDDSLQTLGHF